MHFKMIHVGCFISALLLFASCSKNDSTNTVTGPGSVFEENGLDRETLQAGIDVIADGDFGKINSIMVVRNGDIVVEEYFRGWDRTDLHEIFSVTKSITSILIGIAIDKGLIDGVDSKLLSYFPEYDTYENYDSLKAEITLHDVLSMKSGFEWSETLLGPERGDWVKYVLDLPMSEPPGTRFRYNSGTTLVLGGLLQNVVDESVEEFARHELFTPANVLRWLWGVIPREGLPGFHDTSGGLAMKPLDMANIGMLMLEKGRRHDIQIVSEEWVELSTRSHANAGGEFEYAYKWWRFGDAHSAVAGLDKNDVYFAWGAGGQFLFVIPHLQMVVVSTAENFEDTGERFFDILRDYIFAAVVA